jgi:hypothetical protein
MGDGPIPLSSASALSAEEREEREAFERRIREIAEAERHSTAGQDLATWRGVAEQLLTMVESDLVHERRVRSTRISDCIAAVVDALRGASAEAITQAVGALSDEVWGTEPDPDGPMDPAVAVRRRSR